LLAREIDHRVKNSLAVVASLLSMQRSSSENDETRRALADAADRVRAVARVHEQLHQSDTLGQVAFDQYLSQMCADLAASMRKKGVELSCEADPVKLPAEIAMPLALITNELVTNAFKHGVTGGATKIGVRVKAAPDHIELDISDNGPAGIVMTGHAGLGLTIVDALSRQLCATFRQPGAGEPAHFVFHVPIDGQAISNVNQSRTT
jgi:chemotaxis family two-component system sensor kinase Cph1